MSDTQGRTCLHHAATGKKGNSSAVPWLLKEGHDPNLPDRDGWTPLHWAAKTGNAETIAILEHAGAKFSIEFIMGWTPDDVAVFHHHKMSWKTKTALGCGVQTSEPTLEEDTSTASLKADARDVGRQAFPDTFQIMDRCCGCDLKCCGLRHKCMTCRDSGERFDYCFKCKQSSKDTHPGYIFIESPAIELMA